MFLSNINKETVEFRFYVLFFRALLMMVVSHSKF